MKKMPFTQEGLDKKREELYSLPENEFRSQLKEIQHNTDSWVKDNFTLNEEQIDYLNSMPKEILSEIGLSTAIAIDYKLKLTLTTPETSSSAARIRICKNTEVSGSVRGHWSEGESPVIDSWNISVGFTF